MVLEMLYLCDAERNVKIIEQVAGPSLSIMTRRNAT